MEKTKCPGSNVSSVQIQGDSDYFINHLGVPATQFSYEDIKASEVAITKNGQTENRKIELYFFTSYPLLVEIYLLQVHFFRSSEDYHTASK